MCHCHDDDPLRGFNCCHCVNPFTKDLRICCDCDGQCCERFRADTRDCFWPDFTHPTWLCCRILYSCDPLSCPCKEKSDPCDPKEDKCKKKHCC